MMQLTDILAQAGGMPGGQRSGAGGRGGLLGRDGNGNPRDDILRQVGRMSR